MEIQQLIYFKTAAEYENLSRAAEKLYISQPALSKTIQRLETDLGTELFERQGKTVHLNRSGRIALAYTNEILKNIEDMRESLQEQKLSPDHLFVITNLPNLIRYVIPHCMQENSYMNVVGRYMESIHNIQSILENGIGDVVICDRPEKIAGVECIPLLQDRLFLNVPYDSPLVEKGWVDFKDLNGMYLIDSQDSTTSRSVRIVKELLERHCSDIHYVQTIDVGSMQYLLETTNYAVISSSMTSIFWKPAKRHALPFKDASAAIDYYLFYPVEKMDRCRPFVKWMKDWCLWANQMFLSEYNPFSQ